MDQLLPVVYMIGVLLLVLPAFLQSNSTWVSIIHSIDKNNLYLERAMNLEIIIKSITKREITQLANKYFNGIYFSDIQLISE